jgi:hypothetical protein
MSRPFERSLSLSPLRVALAFEQMDGVAIAMALKSGRTRGEHFTLPGLILEPYVLKVDYPAGGALDCGR